jgi:hypothetical protein
MLSSAHILAMDTKNLLDVCDSIRARFPHVKYELPEVPVNSEQLQQEVYENVTKSEQVVEQIYHNQAPPTDIGIYDNQAAIQEQLRIVEEPTSPVDAQFNSQKILSN